MECWVTSVTFFSYVKYIMTFCSMLEMKGKNLQLLQITRYFNREQIACMKWIKSESKTNAKVIITDMQHV
jgi:hypothetical protein